MEVKKYENVQNGSGGVMGGALIETEARRLRDEEKKEYTLENDRKTAIKMLKSGKLTFEEIAEYSGLSVEEVKHLEAQLAEPQTV